MNVPLLFVILAAWAALSLVEAVVVARAIVVCERRDRERRGVYVSTHCASCGCCIGAWSHDDLDDAVADHVCTPIRQKGGSLNS